MSKLHDARVGAIIPMLAIALAVAACGGSDDTVHAQAGASPRPTAAVSDAAPDHHELLQTADAAERWAEGNARVCETESISADAAETCRDGRRNG